MITRAQMLAITDLRDDAGQRRPFSIRFVTRNASRRKAPSLHKYCASATRGGARHDLYKHGQIAIHPTDGSHPIPVHIDLITEINGQQVL